MLTLQDYLGIFVVLAISRIFGDVAYNGAESLLHFLIDKVKELLQKKFFEEKKHVKIQKEKDQINVPEPRINAPVESFISKIEEIAKNPVLHDACRAIINPFLASQNGQNQNQNQVNMNSQAQDQPQRDDIKFREVIENLDTSEKDK